MVKELVGEQRVTIFTIKQLNKKQPGISLREGSLVWDIQDLSSCAGSAPYYPCDLEKIT